MLFLLFGSSAAGKTVALAALHDQVTGLAIHDFDEIGVPPAADTSWRQRANEDWLLRALDYQSQGMDLLLAGQTPLGELLAAPSALRVDAVSACLLDCSDETRLTRLGGRGTDWLARAGAELDDYLDWAEWLRGHARNPRWEQGVIRSADGDDQLRWERWADWRQGDPRWRVRVVDSSELSVAGVAEEISAWIAEERELLHLGQHPLALWAESMRSASAP